MKKYIIGGVAALVVIGGVVIYGVSQSGNSQAAATPSPEITATPEPTIEPTLGLGVGSSATLDSLSEAQIQIFKEASEAFKQDYINGAITLDQLKLFQNTEIETSIIYNQLPSNGVQLFEEWKELVNYYKDLESLKADNGSSSNTGSTGSTGSSSNTGSSGQVNTGNKPNNSDSQNNQQVSSGNNGGSNGVENGVLQIKVKHQNEKSPAKFARPKKGATNQTGEKALTGRGKIWLLKITFAR